MPTQENENVVRGFYEAVFNKADAAAVKEWVAPDFVDHNPFPGQAPDREGLSRFVTLFHAPLPDLRVELEEVIAKDDKVAVRWTARSTHRGGFLGVPATGRGVMLAGMDIIRVANGKVAEHWGYQDQLGAIREIGVLPALGLGGR